MSLWGKSISAINTNYGKPPTFPVAPKISIDSYAIPPVESKKIMMITGIHPELQFAPPYAQFRGPSVVDPANSRVISSGSGEICGGTYIGLDYEEPVLRNLPESERRLLAATQRGKYLIPEFRQPYFRENNNPMRFSIGIPIPDGLPLEMTLGNTKNRSSMSSIGKKFHEKMIMNKYFPKQDDNGGKKRKSGGEGKEGKSSGKQQQQQQQKSALPANSPAFAPTALRHNYQAPQQPNIMSPSATPTALSHIYQPPQQNAVSPSSIPSTLPNVIIQPFPPQYVPQAPAPPASAPTSAEVPEFGPADSEDDEDDDVNGIVKQYQQMRTMNRNFSRNNPGYSEWYNKLYDILYDMASNANDLGISLDEYFFTNYDTVREIVKEADQGKGDEQILLGHLFEYFGFDPSVMN